MANIILPQVSILNKINDSTNLMVEQNGEINRYPISDLDITEDQVVMDDGHTLGSKLASEYATNDFVNERVKKAAPRNLLDNSDFRNPVNQRGQTSYTGGGYTIDRWKQWLETDNITVNDDGYITVSGNGIHQIIDAKNFKNTIYTLVAKTIDGHFYIVVNNPLSGNEVNQNNLLFTSKDTNGLITVAVRGGSYVWAALYEGEYREETLPEYQPKGYGAELAECQRYHREDECVLVCKSTASYFALGETYYLRDMGDNVPTVTLKKFTKPGVIDITSFSTDSLRIEHVGVSTYIVGFAELPSCSNYDIGILRFSINADI